MADNIKANDFMIANLGASREINRWIYDSKVGTVSGVFSVDNRYVVVKVSGSQEAGLMKLDENMKPNIERAVKTEKKAKMIMDKYKGQSSLEAVAQASQQQVMQADSFNASTPSVSYTHLTLPTTERV